MADIWSTPPTQDELSGSPPAPNLTPQTESGPDPDLPGGMRSSSRLGPAPSKDTSVPVLEPDGAIAPVSDGRDVWSTPPTAAEMAQTRPQTAVNQAALQFVAQHGDLPTPDRAAQILRYSAASGLPAELVAADLEGVKKRVDAAGVDWKKLAERQPGLAQFLAENPNAIPLAKEDHKNLGMLEWSLKAPWAAFMDAWHQQGTTAYQFLRAEGIKGLDDTIQKRLDEERTSEASYGSDYGAENFVSRGLIGAIRVLPYYFLDESTRFVSGALGAAAGAAAGAETGPGAVVTGAAGGALSQFVGSGIFNYAEAVGPMSWANDHAVDEHGQHIDPKVANAAAQMGAIASGALMAGLGPFGSKLAPKLVKFAQGYAPKLAEDLASNAVVKWLGDSEVRSYMAKFAGRWGIHTMTGAGVMAANSAVTAAEQEGARAASGMEYSPMRVGQAFVEGGAQGLKDMWLFAGASVAGRDYLGSLGRDRASAEGVARLEQTLQAAQASTTLQKSPEAFHAFVDLTAPDAKVYVPADRWVSYFQDKKLDPAKVAEATGVKPEELQKALDSGGNLEFKASDFLTNLTKDGHAQGLSMDIKSDPALETAREFKASQDAQAKRIVEAQKNQGAELEQGKKAIESFIVDQARASKLRLAPIKAGAKLLSAAAETYALNSNVSIQEAARQLNLGELSLSGAEGPTAEHPAIQQKFREWMAPSASTQLKARLESMSPETRARELYIDPNTGLPNEKHFAELPEGQGLYGNVSVEGIKFANDTMSHDRADLLYRAAGKALHEADPTANVSKTGGDFELRVRDQAHLDEILKKANESLPQELRVLALTGAAGETAKAAKDAHVELRQKAEESGARAPRGQKPLGLQGDLSRLPEAKAAVEPHPEIIKRVGGLTDEQYFNQAYVDQKTGLLTNLGWQAIPRKRWVAAFDLKKLKLANSVLGEKGGDALIHEFGKLATRLGGSSFDFARLHGDEYAAQHDDPARLQAFIDRIYDRAKDVGVDAGDGEFFRLKFRHGIGRDTYEAADAELNRRKTLESKDSTGLERRTQGSDAGGAGGPGQEGGAQGYLRGGPRGVGAGDESRGAGPQVYPGSRGAGQEGLLNQEAIAHVEGRKVTLEQRNKKDVAGGPRGEIRMDLSDTGRPRAFDIRLLNSDASTFLHETAHFLSFSLHDLATSDLSTPQVRADYDALLKFAGYDSPLDRLRAVKEGTQKVKEERIASAFEQYVTEGKAPSRALARVFSRFKGWLLKIYNGIAGIQGQYEQQYGQKLELSDEVRGVFDRMLAQDTALKDADKAVGGAGALPEAMAGMTPEQQAKYREVIADSQTTADQETARGGPERQQKMKAQRMEFERQTVAEVDSQPVYRAWRYLENGVLPEIGAFPTDNDGKPFKLSRDSVIKEYGEDAARRMPPDSMRAKGGVPADVLAPLLGFNSGDDMVNALSRATPRGDAVSQGTQDKMDAAYGPELERATDAALSGVHNDKDLAAAVMELRGLARQIDPSVQRRANAVDVDAIRKNVDRMTSEKTVGELDPAKYARTERKLALEAAELWGKGEKEAAYEKREQRLLNKLLFMAERDAKQELDAAKDRLRNPSEAIRADLGKADPAYRDVHDSLIQAVGLAPKLVGAEAPIGLDAMLAVADRDGKELGDWADTVRAILQKPAAWKSLTVDQARGVVDTVKNLRHIARDENEVTIAGETKDKKELQQALYSRTASVRPAVKKPAYGGEKPSVMQRVAAKYRGASGSLQELETLADMLDGGAKGPWNDLLVRSFLGSRDREVELIKSTLAPIKEAFEKIPKELLRLRDQSVDVANLLPPPRDMPAGYTRSTLYSLFLNLGNEGNIQRLVDGNGWTRENMLAAVSKLSEPELDFLQRIRDVANKQLFPELARAYEARTGLPLGKVPATPITVNGKTYEGGYWPIRYDRDYEGNQGQRQEINDMKDLLPRVGTPTVTNSATKARQAKVYAPLDLTWGTVPQHFATVIHDIAYGDAVRQVGKMLIKPRIPDENIPSANRTASDFIGKERAAELLPALRDIAADRIDSTAGHITAMVKGTSFLKSRLTAATLMANLPSLARHLTDPLVAAVDTEGVPLPYIAAAYAKVSNPASWGEFAPFKQSKELDYRHVRHEENLRQELGRMGNAEGRLEKATRVGFKLQSLMDAYVSRVAFRAAYDHAKSNGMDEAAAIQRGDDVVRRTMPSGNIAEKAPILRTKQGWASCILFYGYASKIHQVRSRAFDRLYRAWNAEALPDLDPSAPDQGTRANAVANVAAKMIGLGLISALGGYVSGRGPTKEEDDKRGMAASRAEWLATETMLSPMDDAPPVIGPAIKATILGHKTNVGSAPELMLLDRQLGKLGDIVHGKKKEDEDATWSMVANMIGLLGPLGQAQRTVPFIGKASHGRERIRGPLDVAAGAIYGDKKHQGANPLGDLQGVISGR